MQFVSVSAAITTFIRVLLPGEILRRIAPDMAKFEAVPLACRARMLVSGRLVVCGWGRATSSSLLAGSSTKGARGALKGLEKVRDREALWNIQKGKVEETYEIKLNISNKLVHTCLSVSSSGLGAEGGALVAEAICIWQFLAVFSRTSARMMARLLSLASSSAILILSYGEKKSRQFLGACTTYLLSRNTPTQLTFVNSAVAKESQGLNPWKPFSLDMEKIQMILGCM